MAISKTILVTGGAGYIGAHCCKALSKAGYLPVCLDNLSTGHADFVQWGPFVHADIGDIKAVTDTITRYGIAAVMHFAACSAVGESIIMPEKYYANNVCGTLSLLNAMRLSDCKTIVFSSTGAVYGDAGLGPLPETAAGHPVNPYGRSKWMVEQILADHGRAHGLSSISLRYFNACGADPAGQIGERRDPETHLIPRAMMALQRHVPDFSIFGTDYDTPDGTAVRDYIHVADLANAHIRALERLAEKQDVAAFNLGTGRGYSVSQILSAILAETGKAVPTTVKPRRPGDPAVLIADPSAAAASLNFRPIHSDLTSIIQSAWTWHQKAHPPVTPAEMSF